MKKLILSFFMLSLALQANSQTAFSDVAPIFYAHCTSCHNNYSHGPSFLTYSQVLPHTATMTAYLTSGYMPPWIPDTTYSRFSHERIISAADRSMILNWIANGAPAGDTTLGPAPPTYTQYQLTGTPDLELQMPTFTSNAAGNDSYVCISIPSGLTQNRIVRAYEIVAGNTAIVHHVIANVDTMGTTTTDLSGTCYNITGDFSLGGYAPGAPPTVFPSVAPMKMGITIKANSKIVLQIHYPAGTSGLQDSTRIRLYFYPVGTTNVRPVYVTTPLQNWSLNIPANTVQTFTAKYPSGVGTLGFDISMFAAFPHAHKLGTYMMNCAYMGTDTVPLIRINNWDFDWQGYYTFRNLVHVPAGYKLFAKHVYDNTSSNPNNPSSPPVNVYAGTSTTDEMLFDSFQWLVYQPGDELYNIDSILAYDPLLAVNENKFGINKLKTYAYPNPFENNINIGYILEKPANVDLEIYSIYGSKVRSYQGYEAAGSHEFVWNGRSDNGAALAQGTYLYVIRTNGEQCFGKVTLLSGKK